MCAWLDENSVSIILQEQEKFLMGGVLNNTIEIMLAK